MPQAKELEHVDSKNVVKKIATSLKIENVFYDIFM